MRSPIDSGPYADQVAAYNKRRLVHLAKTHMLMPREEDRERVLAALDKLSEWELSDIHALIYHVERHTPAYEYDPDCETCNEPVPKA